MNFISSLFSSSNQLLKQSSASYIKSDTAEPSIIREAPRTTIIELPQLEEESLISNSSHSFLFRLTGLWFISVAAGSVILSIPISAIGLPVVLAAGILASIMISIASMILSIWIYFVKLGLVTIKQVFWSPLKTARYLLSKFSFRYISQQFDNYATNSLPTSFVPATPPYNNNFRRLSALSGKTPSERSFESYQSHQNYKSLESQYQTRSLEPLYTDQAKWKYYSASEPILSPRTPSESLFPSYRKPDLRDTDSEYSNTPRLTNAAFHLLQSSDRERLEMCAQLYSLTTNIPMDKVGLRTGLQGNGNLHHVLSLWNEPEVNEPLELSHLIGFCEYFVIGSNLATFHIDKLNISSTYSENGFSKRIIRKLMNSSECESIQVWSVWHAESFYKGLAFKNVYEPPSSRGKRTRKVEGAHGPLLTWNKNDTPASRTFITPEEDLVLEQGLGLRSKESLLSLGHKSSNVSLKGSGAFTFPVVSVTPTRP